MESITYGGPTQQVIYSRLTQRVVIFGLKDGEVEVEPRHLESLIEALEAAKEDLVTPKIHIGQRYRDPYGEEYLLAQVGIREVALIGLKSGNRKRDTVRVRDTHNISPAEFGLMSSEMMELIE